MSQLPKGTTAARSFLESIIMKGVEIQATGWLPEVAAIPVIGAIYIGAVKWVIEKYLSDPALDLTTRKALAVVFIIDRNKFDESFIEISMLDIQNANPETIEKALQNAENKMFKLIRRGPVS